MENNMTTITRDMFDKAREDLSIQATIKLMRDNFAIRTLKDKILSAAGGRSEDEVRKLITDHFKANQPDAKEDSVRRKVSNWMKLIWVEIGKEDAIGICFALGLSLREANKLLAAITGEAFHRRDPEDIIWMFGLETGMTFAECKKMIDEIVPTLWLSSDGKQVGDKQLTEIIAGKFKNVRTKEGLIALLREEQNQLGHFHNTAYREFMRMIGLLARPDDGFLRGTGKTALPEEKYSMKDVLRIYLFGNEMEDFSAARRALSGVRKGAAARNTLCDAVERSVLSCWPDESVLSRMKNRATDVTRKCLILLYLATCDDYTYSDEQIFEMDDEGISITPEEKMEMFRDRMNDLLDECGYSRLDPRSPFDWLILFCMLPPEEDELWENTTKFRDFLSAYSTQAGIGTQEMA